MVTAAVALGRALRARGLAVAVDEELLLCRALAELDLRRREHVYWAARAALLRGREGVEAFDEVFDRFWAGLGLDVLPDGIAEHGESDPRMPSPQHGGQSLPPLRLGTSPAPVLDGVPTRAGNPLELPSADASEPASARRRGALAAYSPEDIATEPDGLEYDRDELDAVRRLAEEIRRAAPRRRSRRLRPSGRGGRFDVRATFRRSLRTDGEPLELVRLAPSVRSRRLLFVCDVSGSMERYSRALLASLQGVMRAGIRAETFVFATRLTRVSRPLAGRDVAVALEQARGAVPDWSGGTRIGEALSELRRTHGRLGLARGAIVVIVSDGWDRGDPELLVSELAVLRRQCRRLVWLNPRPADLGGQPLAVGMRVALPYVDEFVPDHDPRALSDLARLLRRLEGARPPRRQRAIVGCGRA